MERELKKQKVREFCSANDCTKLRIVHCADDLEKNEWFMPAFTYHAFGKEELIYGYHGLTIELTFAAMTFDCFVNVKYDSKDEEAWDLFEKLKPSLPQNATQDRECFLERLKEIEKLSVPGTRVESYQVKDMNFELFFSELDKDAQSKSFLDKMQKLSLWFIEGADDIDVNDSRWSLYTIWHKVNDVLFYPVGFITMFTFNLPLPQGNMTKSKRICQVVVLPPYQRQGHGERLVKHIMKKAQEDEEIYEITVEDPVPGFSRLRDVVDVAMCLDHSFFSSPPDQKAIGIASGTQRCTQLDITHVKKALKVTKLQVQRCYEILKFRRIDRADENAYKAFRLEVKRRLHALHAEDLEAMSCVERRKGHLANLYTELEAEYDAILRRNNFIQNTSLDTQE
ncbi:histone acetyltransferase [Thraustotheca clavata]|uniref:histone acetyltransferase n=1 Tax=Thraustotheca clavata TaxID=74557 RepID=A0A1V9Z1K5_9STRA|nr:histone acetyltransferase [Thraustotheca clavata]